MSTRSAVVLLLAVFRAVVAAPFFSIESIIFTANDSIKSCYRNPVLLTVGPDELLCFIEERYVRLPSARAPKNRPHLSAAAGNFPPHTASP